jgi:hypothetical protein
MLHSRCIPPLPDIPSAIANLFWQVCLFSRIRSKEYLVQEGWIPGPDHPGPEQIPGFSLGGMPPFIATD